jgi:transposase
MRRPAVVPGANGDRAQHVQTFGTTTAALLTLRDWFEAHGVTHVVMESTGVYCRPVFYVLEDGFTCLLANAAHIAQVPVARPTSRTASGSPSCSSMASSA